jgi:hypothetical protein
VEVGRFGAAAAAVDAVDTVADAHTLSSIKLDLEADFDTDCSCWT